MEERARNVAAKLLTSHLPPNPQVPLLGILFICTHRNSRQLLRPFARDAQARVSELCL